MSPTKPTTLCLRCDKTMPQEPVGGRRGPKRIYCGSTCRKLASRANVEARRLNGYSAQLSDLVQPADDDELRTLVAGVVSQMTRSADEVQPL